MKKLLSLFFIFSIYALSINAQSEYQEAFEQNNTTIDIGTFGAYTHYGSEIRGSMGLDMTVCGFHVDIAGWGAQHSNSVEVGKWYDEPTSFSFHAGYQIPICKVFRVTPIVGYSEVGSADVDGYHWHSNYYGIYNSATHYTISKGFDYGAILSLTTANPQGGPVFNLGITNHQIWAGIGVRMSLKN